MRKILTRCPVCDSELKIKKFVCPSCSIEIEGNFEIPPFFNLEKKDLDFLLLFLKTWGNLSEMAKIMGVSYPTIRSRFQGFLSKIGLESEISFEKDISEILDMLEKGEITPEEAEKRIKELKR
jgi:hypothetical protein